MPEEIPVSKPKKNTRSHLTRILIALAKIYEEDTASVPEKLQALALSSEILERRPTHRRKTDKERAVERALGVKPKPFGGRPIKAKEKAQSED